MRQGFFLFMMGVVFAVYSLLNYYIGFRGWQAFGSVFPFKKIYWFIFWLVVGAYILGRLGERFIKGFNGKYLALIGGYWMAAMYYFLIILPVIDLFRLINRRIGILPDHISGNPQVSLILGFIIVGVICFLLAYGTWNARNPHITRYDITISKKVTNMSKVHLVLLSDIHLGRVVDHERLKTMVTGINKLKPDVVVFAGDIVDENVNILVEQKMAETFAKLNAPLGSYAVLGNHEYIGGHAEEIVVHLEQAGVKVLRDECQFVNNSFYLAGRNDLSVNHFQGPARKPLSQILAAADKALPVILLDHQPKNLDEAREAGVDLQLSGHTHRGQFFPNNYITRRIFEVDWGYLKKADLQVIVSSGYGTWGPPVRIGNYPEIVDIYLTFSGSNK
ncbi:MAG: metallophosphoesterase [Peptococcaceae bacterium]